MKKKKITIIHIPTTDFSMKKNNLSSLMMTLHKWSAWDQTSSLLSKDNDGWQINAPHKKNHTIMIFHASMIYAID